MEPTSLSLFERLQHTSSGSAWNELVDLYDPLLRMWLGKYGITGHDADDLVQEVLLAVTRGLPTFVHNGREGAFRAWLRTILVHRLRDYWRKQHRGPSPCGGTQGQQVLEQLADPDSPLIQEWNQEHDRHVARHLLALAEPQFAPKTWQAFCRVTIDGANPEVVAAELAMTTNSVFVAKSRVLRRLRHIAAGLVDSSLDLCGRSL